MADEQRDEPAPIPWYEESWAVVTAGVAGVTAIGVLIFAVVQTAQNSVEPSYGPQYYTDYSTSTTGSSTTTTRTTTTRTTTTRTTTSRTTTTPSETTTTSPTTTTTTSETTTTPSETTGTTTTTTTTTSGLDDENPFILNPFASTTENSDDDG